MPRATSPAPINAKLAGSGTPEAPVWVRNTPESEVNMTSLGRVKEMPAVCVKSQVSELTHARESASVNWKDSPFVMLTMPL